REVCLGRHRHLRLRLGRFGCRTGFFVAGFGGGSKQPHSSFHLSKSYSSWVITLRMKTFWPGYSTRAMSRYLFPPTLKTTQLPTMLALAKAAFTSAQVCQETVLLLTWVYHARSGPSASWCPGCCQNFLSRDFEITRIRCFCYRHPRAF